LPHIYNHEVDEDEVTEVLEKPGEDRPGREGSRIRLWPNRLRPVLAGRLCSGGISPEKKEETTMSENKFPSGRDEEKVRRVLAHYDEQTEEGALSEDEAGVEPSETVMKVPYEQVSKVRELIAKGQS
jgi:hypothetical protein